MTGPNNKRDTGCPVTFALDTFGDRWTLLVIRYLLIDGKKTYGEFLETKEGIATNILADRLKVLETEGIVRKTRDPENRRSFIYSLTEKGFDLIPVLLEMIRWSAKYDPNTSARPRIVKRIKSDRDGLAAELRAQFPKP